MNPIEAFDKLPDPRRDHGKIYPLRTIVFLTISAVVSGVESWAEIEEFGRDKLDWLKRFVDCPDDRIPSHDTLCDFFKRPDPKSFSSCFVDWVAQVCGLSEGDLIAIDGKRVRGSYDRWDNKSAIHIVSAWASANSVTLAQVKVDDRSNEITAIPQLLSVLELKGAVVSIDAMGCQKDIAQRIVEAGADYILGLKGNQSELHDQVVSHFGYARISSCHIDINKDHGRIEERTCKVISDLSMLDEARGWPSMASVIQVASTRTQVISEKASKETRYYISSRLADAQTFNKYIRGHWGIENKLHWVLDVLFHEDDCRGRKGHADENLTIIRKIALNLISLDNTPKLSKKIKQQKAMRNDVFREKILKV